MRTAHFSLHKELYFIGIWSFLYYHERSYFFLPKISSYSLDGKSKMIFLKKKYMEIWYFLQKFRKVGLSKKNRTGIWSFLLYYLEKWYLFFPKIWSYSLDGKRKTIFVKKNTWKYAIFFKCRKKIVFLKKISLEYDLCCIIWKHGIFFSKKISYFFFRRIMKDDLFQDIHGNMMFSVYMYKCYKYNITLQQKKIKDDLLPKKCT